jgi:hypothetical protein
VVSLQSMAVAAAQTSASVGAKKGLQCSRYLTWDEYLYKFMDGNFSLERKICLAQ